MTPKFKFFFASLALASITTLSAQTVGYVSTSAAASATGTSLNLTQLSLPLLAVGNIQGQSTGVITGVTSNTISNSNAGWAANTLAVAGSPYFIQITSGTNAGRTFQITANTATQLTVNNQGLDFTVTANNPTSASYQIVEGVTLLELFGAPVGGNPASVVGGTSAQFTAGQTDRVTINDPVSNTSFVYWFDTAGTNPNQWRRALSSANQGSVVISPMAGVLYGRIGTTALPVLVSGVVPTQNLMHQVAALGQSIIANPFPVDTTLSALNIENMTGSPWRRANANGVTIATSDRVLLKSGSTFFSYYYDAAPAVGSPGWRRALSNSDQGIVAVPAGSALRFVRAGSAGQFSTWTLNRSNFYTLN